METDSPYQILSSQKIYENPWYWLQHDEVKFPDGITGTYTTVKRGPASFIIPVLQDGRIAMIRHYRYTVGRWLWEIPAGGVEDGMIPLEAARKELLEEIGGTCGSLEQVGVFYTMPGISDEISYIFIARAVSIGSPQREPSEVIETHLLTLDEVRAMLHRGQIADGPSALSLFLAMPFLLPPAL